MTHTTSPARGHQFLSLLAAFGCYWAGQWAYEASLSEGPQSLFDGRSLSGWAVPEKFVFSKHGAVKVEQGVIALPAGNPATGIVWSGSPLPVMNYELRLEARRVAGSDFFCGLTFPVAESHCTLILGGWGGAVIGLSDVDNHSAVENETTETHEFQDQRWYRLRLRVTPEKIEAWLDNRQIIDLTSKDRQFAVWWEQEPVRPLGISTWHTGAEIRQIFLKRLGP